MCIYNHRCCCTDFFSEYDYAFITIGAVAQTSSLSERAVITIDVVAQIASLSLNAHLVETKA